MRTSLPLMHYWGKGKMNVLFVSFATPLQAIPSGGGILKQGSQKAKSVQSLSIGIQCDPGEFELVAGGGVGVGVATHRQGGSANILLRTDSQGPLIGGAPMGTTGSGPSRSGH